jgi:hypothetical protein
VISGKLGGDGSRVGAGIRKSRDFSRESARGGEGGYGGGTGGSEAGLTDLESEVGSAYSEDV